MAASQSQRRKAHCSAPVPRACWDMAAGTLSFSAVTNGVCQCCGQHRMPVRTRGGKALRRKALGGPEGQTLGTGPRWVQEWGVTCRLPTSSPPSPLARLPHGSFLSHTYPSALLQPHHLHILILSPCAGQTPRFLKALLRFLIFGKLVVRVTPRSGPAKTHGMELRTPCLSAALPPGRKVFPSKPTLPRKPQSRDTHEAPVSFLEEHMGLELCQPPCC